MEPGQQIRDFILEKKIGAGGVGEVWRARHQHLDKPYAIKAVFRHLSNDARFHDRFIQEAKAMGQFDHQHIVGLHDFFYLDDNSYLVMSYIEGGSLDVSLRQDGLMPVEKALKISGSILDALNFAHSKGVIHRDVKPSNILLNPNGHAYLVDFGIAIVVGEPRMTQFGKNIGTIEYMSPEQITAGQIDHRTDVYSFGCVMYEMLSGRPPFGIVDGQRTDFDVMNDHMNKPPPSLKQLNPELDDDIDAVVQRAMAKNPGDRYQSCRDMAEALDGRRHSSNQKATRQMPPPTNSDKPRSKILVVLVIILALTTAIGAAGWIIQLQKAGKDKPPTGLQTQNTKSSHGEMLKELKDENSKLKDENSKLIKSITRLGQQLDRAETELEKLKKKVQP